MASPSHDRHNFFRREIHDETKAYIRKIIVDLHLGFLVVPMAGFEPAPLILWELCSTIKLRGQIQDAKEKIVGFEPATFWLTVKRSTIWAKYFLSRKNCCMHLYYGCWSLQVEWSLESLWDSLRYRPPASNGCSIWSDYQSLVIYIVNAY